MIWVGCQGQLASARSVTKQSQNRSMVVIVIVHRDGRLRCSAMRCVRASVRACVARIIPCQVAGSCSLQVESSSAAGLDAADVDTMTGCISASTTPPPRQISTYDWRQAPRCEAWEGREKRPCRFRCEATKTLLIHTTHGHGPSNGARLSRPR